MISRLAIVFVLALAAFCKAQEVLVPGSGWQRFSFGSLGVFASPEFTVTTGMGDHMLISITDDLCPGDRFELLANSAVLGTTSPAPIRQNCDPAVTATQAFDSGRYSRGQFALRPGTYTLQIRPTTLAYSGDSGWIRVDIIKRVNTRDFSTLSTDFGIVESGARRACATYRRAPDLAALDSASWNRASNQAFNAEGAFSRLWIDSWNGDNYGNTCIAFHLDSTPSSPSINVPLGSCFARIKALCQRSREHEHDDDHEHDHGK